MSKVKSKNSVLETNFRKELWKRGMRYRIHYKIKGKPDIVFVSNRIAVFVDSCFWHGCPEHLRKPNSNKKYWDAKIKRNVKRDREVTKSLKREGWKVLRFWEHDLKNNSEQCIEEIMNEFTGL